MVKAIIAGKLMPEVLDLAGRLHTSRKELFEALQPEDLSDAHLVVLTEVMAHIQELEARPGSGGCCASSHKPPAAVVAP